MPRPCVSLRRSLLRRTGLHSRHCGHALQQTTGLLAQSALWPVRTTCKELTKGAVGFRIKPSSETDQIHQPSSPYRHGVLFNQPRAVIIGIRWNRLCNHHHGGSGMRTRSGHHPRRIPLESPRRAATHRTSDPLLPGHSALRILHPGCADVLRQPQPDPLRTPFTLSEKDLSRGRSDAASPANSAS